jgi:hypothetical protein
MSVQNRTMLEDIAPQPSRLQDTPQSDQVKHGAPVPSLRSDEGNLPEQLSFPFAIASMRPEAVSCADACSAVERHRISGGGWQHLVDVLAGLGDPDDRSPGRPLPAVTVSRDRDTKIEKAG